MSYAYISYQVYAFKKKEGKERRKEKEKKRVDMFPPSDIDKDISHLIKDISHLIMC